MLKLLVIVGITAGLAAGGFFAYKHFRRPAEDEWTEDPMTGAAEIHQAADVPPV
jgi:hypothetical protein